MPIFYKNKTVSSGERGASAYEIAVKNGFTGTEEEWLDSLKCEQGPPGNVNIEDWTGNLPISAIEGLSEALQRIPREMTADELRKILMNGDS